MDVLIVQSNKNLGQLWARHLERMGSDVTIATNGSQAIDLIEENSYDVIVLDLVLAEGSALTIADFANFKMPQSNVVFVTDTTFFSDGSIFVHSANARAFVEKRTPPGDLAAIVNHYGLTDPRGREARRSPVLD